MKIAHFLPLIACKPGFETNVSGHVQVPLHAMKLLADAGHDVHLVTNAPNENRPVLPAMMPDNLKVHYVEDGRVRKKVVAGVGGSKRGIRPAAMLRQVRQVRSILRDQKIDVFHTWGYARTAHFGALLQRISGGVPAVATLFDGPRDLGAWPRLLRRNWRRLALVTATEHVAGLCRDAGLQATVIRHGPVRDLVGELEGTAPEPVDRVLFWRDPSRENGADVCVAAFDVLSPNYPAIRFELAIRPHWSEVAGIDALCARHRNVHVHRFPYPEGVTLPELVVGSLCVPMLFRADTIHPQLVIAETMAAGVPLVATDIGSTAELVRPGETGAIVAAGDVQGTIDALDQMVADPHRTRIMGRAAAKFIADEWNWNHYVRDLTTVYERVTS